MSQIAVVYWSGTGNTEAMAQKVAEGARGAGAETQLFTACEFDASKMDEFDAIAFGCPSMGRRTAGRQRVRADVRRLPRELRAKRTRCSAPTAGATASGCAIGASVSRRTARSCSAKRASSATRRPTTMSRLPAASWALTWLHGKPFLLTR